MTVGVVVGYTLRSCLGVRRWAAVALPCMGMLLFGLLSRAIDLGRDTAFANVAAEALFGLLVPVAALVIGDAVLGAEVRAGTFHFTWLSPVPLWQIVVGRWLGGWLVALASVVPACALAAVLAGSPSSVGPVTVAAAAATGAYVALFVAVGSITRRTAVWSLAIVFLVERLLGAALTGIAQISPTWQSRAVFVGLLDDPPRRLLRDGVPEGFNAVGRLAIVAAVALGVAVWRMRHLQLSGPAD